MTERRLNIDPLTAGSDGGTYRFHEVVRGTGAAQGIPLFSQGGVPDAAERRRTQEQLERSHHELQKMIATLDALREEEQKRLAQEMHDDLGQLLAAMKMDLSVLKQHLSQDDARSLRQLNNIDELVDTMVVSVRRIIADLPPKTLDDLGLFSALALLVSSFEQRHCIMSRLRLPQPEPVVSEAIAMPVYRMVQEALHNVAKHANATRVDVGIDCGDCGLVLCIADNGEGLSRENLQKPGSYGLIGMRERAAALGGKVAIESNTGADAATGATATGTTIRIIIPMNWMNADCA